VFVKSNRRTRIKSDVGLFGQADLMLQLHGLAQAKAVDELWRTKIRSEAEDESGISIRLLQQNFM